MSKPEKETIRDQVYGSTAGQTIFITGITSLNMNRKSHVWQPPTDVYETEETIIIRVEIAGMKKDDFSINLEQNQLTITGVRADTTRRKSFQQMEIRFGEFFTIIEIGSPIEASGVEANYRDGFLIVTLPKAKPKRINIKAKTN